MAGSDTPNDYQSALAAVTGITVDLRGAADPAGGFLHLLAPGADEAWWTFSAFGKDFFSVDFNHPATERWAEVVTMMSDLAPELAAGKRDLMDLPRLRDATTMTQGLARKLSDAVTELSGIVAPLENGQSMISGTAVSVLLDHLHNLGDAIQAQAMALIDHPSPAVAVVLDDAAEALHAFGQQMAEAFWRSNDALLNAIANGWNTIFTNMLAYLDQVGIMPDTQRYNALAADPPAAISYAHLMLGRYSSTLAGTLEHNIAPISGDLSQAPVWAAADAAIKHLISVELDRMDVVAGKLMANLKTAYDNATNRLNGVSITYPAGRSRLLAPASAIEPGHRLMAPATQALTPPLSSEVMVAPATQALAPTLSTAPGEMVRAADGYPYNP